jgi:TonB family protein
MRSRTLVSVLVAIAALSVGVRTQNEPVYEVGKDVTAPVLVKSVRAVYTKEAIAQRIEGSVVLDTIVQSDGKVGEVKVVQSLDPVFGLDQEAVKAVKQYEFKPGTKDNKPVAVRVKIQVTFTLK